MTPTQRVKCDLLGIELDKWGVGGGWWVSRKTGQYSFHNLCTPDDGPPATWPTKRFKTINAAIEAAAAPEKHGLAWDN